MKVINSYCPGCSILCGVHIIEDGEDLDIDFMKYCPINEGKLCKFGVELPEYYSNNLKTAYVKGANSSYEDAINKASTHLKKWISNSEGEEGVILCCGDVTNEEVIALMKVANALGLKCSSGLGHIVGIVGNAPLIHDLPNFDIIENMQNIVLVDLDPYYQYPLIARKLQNAKTKGIPITSIGTEGTNNEKIAQDTILCNPFELPEKLKEFAKDAPPYSLFISPMGIYSEPSLIAEINNLCAKTDAKAMFLKDYANTEAILAFDFDNTSRSMDDIIKDIEQGNITALILVESPLYDTYLDNERFRNACNKLENFIVIQSTAPKYVPQNAIIIPLPQFYKRRGTLLNVCGRLLESNGDRDGVIEVFNDIFIGMGSNNLFEFNDLNNDARGFYKKWRKNLKEYLPVEVPTSKVGKGPYHHYMINPYLLRGQRHQLCKRAGEDVISLAKEKYRYVLQKKVAKDVVISYEKDEKFKSVSSPFE